MILYAPSLEGRNEKNTGWAKNCQALQSLSASNMVEVIWGHETGKEVGFILYC